jgi:hypothetical protein
VWVYVCGLCFDHKFLFKINEIDYSYSHNSHPAWLYKIINDEMSVLQWYHIAHESQERTIRDMLHLYLHFYEVFAKIINSVFYETYE